MVNVNVSFVFSFLCGSLESVLFWDYATERNARKRPSILVPLVPISFSECKRIFPKDFEFALCFVSEYISTLELQFSTIKEPSP